MQAAYYTGHARGIHPWRKRAAIDGRAALQIACGGARPTSSPAKVHSGVISAGLSPFGTFAAISGTKSPTYDPWCILSLPPKMKLICQFTHYNLYTGLLSQI